MSSRCCCGDVDRSQVTQTACMSPRLSPWCHLSLGHTVQRCTFFTKDPELWTLLCTAGSEVQVSLLNFKVVNFHCIKPRAPRGS